MTDIHDPGHDPDDLRERGAKGGGSRTMERTCPLCGESVTKQLAFHLPCEGSQ